MLGVMKRHLVLAGKAVGGAGLTGAVLYLVASVPAHVHIYWPYWVFLVAIVAGIALYFAGQERSAAAGSTEDPEPASGGQSATAASPGPAVTDRWRPTMNGVSSEMLQLQNNVMNHPGYTTRSPLANPPPSVRIGTRMACAQLDPAASTSDLRASYLRFLGQPAVMDLVRELTEIGDGTIWTARDDNPPFNFGAVLAARGTEEAPVAWARILLPDSLTQQYGRDARCAYLVLYVEPRTVEGAPAPPASLVSWHQRLSGTLRLPAALAAFLVDDLELATAADPAAETGVWLKAPRDLRELVEVDAFEVVPGSPQSNWFMGFAIASADGDQVSDAVLAWLRQMCDSSLHLVDYEPTLTSIRAKDDVQEIAADEAAIDTDDGQQSSPTTTDILAQRFGTEWEPDIGSFARFGQQPGFTDVSRALHRASELGIISKHGMRAPLECTSAYLRIPHPDDWPSDSVIPLLLEERWLEEIFVHEWTPDQSFIDVFYSIAAKLRSVSRWEGEASYNPDATFDHFASLLLYGIELIRTGHNGLINRIFQVVGDDWVITEWEVIDKENEYQILLERFNEMDWQEHVSEKGWVNRNNFNEAFSTAQMLIYDKIFDGRLPTGWTPPTHWPFRTWLEGGAG
jgi:hypothetical protein